MTIDPALLDDLRQPRAYAHAPARVDVVQTHISCVFLAGPDVYKVKKAVRFSFLDFSTLEQRRRFCMDEVRLNRRLAPDVYVGVVPIVRTPDGHRVGGAGDPVEYAVHMRRLPDERLLRALVERGEAEVSLMDRIAVKMAAFHARPDTEPKDADGATPEAIARTLAETFAGLGSYAAAAGIGPLEDACAGVALDAVRALADAALARIAATLRDRRASGCVRDGHGDLRPDHICCTESLPILDCVEFNTRLRTCDVASEIAFLASELEFLDAAALADAFIAAYARASGDHELGTVLPFFRAYRAAVRAMVAALTAAESEVDAAVRNRQRLDATRYLALASRRTWMAQGPVLVVVMGQSGTGKSTVAAALARATGGGLLRSDVVRKRLLGLAPLARPTADEAARLYAPAHSDAVYAALASDAARMLETGVVIVDATFQRARDRGRLRDVAGRRGIPIAWIVCQAAPDVITQRLRDRARRNDDPSDATPAVAATQALEFAPLLPRDTPRLLVATDTADDAAAVALRWLARRLTQMDAPESAC